MGQSLFFSEHPGIREPGTEQPGTEQPVPLTLLWCEGYRLRILDLPIINIPIFDGWMGRNTTQTSF
jgi:hypothetical protein